MMAAPFDPCAQPSARRTSELGMPFHPLAAPVSPTVSVIIPSYNMAWCVGEAIESALAQDLPGLEVIVVDDGSTDDTPERLQRYAGRVVIHRQDNQGLAAARNTGIRQARGSCLIFLDADDRLLPSSLTRQWAALQLHPDHAAVYSDGLLVTPQGRVLNRVSAESPAGLFSEAGAREFRRQLLRGHPPPIHSALLRRAAVLEAGLFDESYSAREDLDFWLRFSKGRALLHLPGQSFAYTVRADSMSRSSDRMQTQTLRLYGLLQQDPQFQAESPQERAAHLRAWAIELGHTLGGTGSEAHGAVCALAKQALQLDPTCWRSRLLVVLLDSWAGLAALRLLLSLQKGWRRAVASTRPDSMDTPR